MSITLQYINPVMIGDSSPATTASIVSSRRLRPADDVALIDERAALHVAGRRDEVRISERLADRDGLACGRVRRISLALTQLLLGDGEAR